MKAYRNRPALSGSNPGGRSQPSHAAVVPPRTALLRALWNAQNLDDYRYTHDVVCPFCGTTGPLQVTVRDGQVVDVREEGGDPLPREVWAGEVFTVDEIFAQLTEAQSRNEHTEASYHRSLGYPVNFVIGTVSSDAGIRMLFSDLTRIR